MEKSGIKVAVFGVIANTALFFLKFYISVSSGSLTIYCDAVNNLFDSLSCVIALISFIVMIRLCQQKGKRVQSLATFVIGFILAFVGGYFAYGGIERIMYPSPISFSPKYAVLLGITIIFKIIMTGIYAYANRKNSSPIYKTLILDGFLDCSVTAAALISFFMASKINYAIDGIFSIIIGAAVMIGASKTIFKQAKQIIND